MKITETTYYNVRSKTFYSTGQVFEIKNGMAGVYCSVFPYRKYCVSSRNLMIVEDTPEYKELINSITPKGEI